MVSYPIYNDYLGKFINMESLLVEIDTPAIDAFCKAATEVTNGGTVLFKVRTDETIRREENYLLDRDILDKFMASDLFGQMWLELDLKEYSSWLHELEDDGWKARYSAHEVSSKLIKKLALRLYPISIFGFVDHLYWMLRTVFSPYHTHKSEDEAQVLIQDFLNDLFGAESFNLHAKPEKWFGPPNWIGHSWQFYYVLPNFLRSSGYFDKLEEDTELAYFDGGNADSCLYFYKDKTFYLLLTCGSP